MSQTLLDRLAEAEVAFVVVGGMAAVLHGADIVTVDLDVCYEPSAENRRRLAAALAPLGPHPRGWEPGSPFAWDARTLADARLLTLTTTAGALDLLTDVPGVGGYPDVRAASEAFDVGSRSVRVLSLDALIRAKRTLGRPKDRIVLPVLEALHARRPPAAG